LTTPLGAVEDASGPLGTCIDDTACEIVGLLGLRGFTVVPMIDKATGSSADVTDATEANPAETPWRNTGRTAPTSTKDR
jgi:hypothetical protein